MTQLTWRYVNLLFPEMLSTLAEPAEGNPPEIYSGNKLISQDIANSVLEFDSMNFDNRLSDARVVCELGGGYGRTAYVVQRQHGGCKYIMVDIPPALAVAQTYMEQVFPNRKIFGFRPFRTFEEVRNDVANADIVFLLPHQMALLPDEFIDYFINISSLHEMRQEQIDLYLHEIFRLTAPGGSFYLKAWKTSKNPVDKVEIRAEDYRLSDWTPLYNRTARIQTRFFETVLKKP